MKNIIIILVAMIGGINLNGQHEYTIDGIIKEEATSAPLISASIHFCIDSITLGIITEIDGRFEFKTKYKPDSIIIKHTGYETRKIKTNFDEKNKMHLDIELKYSKTTAPSNDYWNQPNKTIKWEKKSIGYHNALQGKWRTVKYYHNNKKYNIKRLNKKQYSYFEIEFKSIYEFNFRYRGNWAYGVKYIFTEKDELEFKHIGLESTLLPIDLNQKEIFTSYNDIIDEMITNSVNYKIKRKRLILTFNENKIAYKRIKVN